MPEIIDLSQTFKTSMPVYPGTQPIIIHEAYSIDNDGFKETCLSFFTHTGTHIDVPAHIFSDGKSIDSFECNKFYGPGMIIECACVSVINETLITEAYYNGNKPDFLLFHTGWSDFWGNDKYFDGFPLLSDEAVILISRLPLKGIGIDAISIDAVGNNQLTNHKIILGSDMIIIENLCNLRQLIHKEFIFSALPLKIEGADGSPVRACAIIEP
jgi:kynurenine formamidase